MLTKEQIIEAIEAMPEEELDVKIVAERLLLLNKIQQAEEDIKNGRVYTHEQMKEHVLLEKINKGLQAIENGEVLSEKEVEREVERS